MVNHEDPNTWTKEYVVSNRVECMRLLQEINLLVICYIDQRQYDAAVAGLDRLLNGLLIAQNSHRFGDIGSHLSILSFVEGMVIAFGDFSQPAPENNRRDTALALFKDARDLTENDALAQSIVPIISSLQSGMPLIRIKQIYTVDFPDGLTDLLQDVDTVFLTPEGNGVSTRHQVPSKLKKAKLKKGRSKETPKSFSKRVDFNEMDDEYLEWAYARVKRRRNIYGILSIFPPFGVLLWPFWLRAVFLTKWFQLRDYQAARHKYMSNFFLKLIAVFYGLPTLYIYPMIMNPIIRWTNWGMGLRDRRALIPTFALLALIVFWTFGGSSVSFPDISGFIKSPERTTASDLEQTEQPYEEVSDSDDIDEEQLYQESGFIFPNSGTELIAQEELANLSDRDLTYAINEIYARHGYIFRSNELREYFEQFSWYTGETPADEFSVDCFNQIEQQNWNLLVDERTSRTSSD